MEPKKTSIAWMFWLMLAMFAIPLIPLPAEAQLGQRIRDRAQRQAEQRAERRAAQAVERALDGVECVVTDPECIESARADGQEVVLTDEQGQPLGEEAAVEGAAAMDPGEGVWTNYDFVPGDRVIWAEDFTADNVGDFPRRMHLIRGNLEVAEWQGQRWLRSAGDARIAIELPETMPQQFTIEFDYIGGRGLTYAFMEDEMPGPRTYNRDRTRIAFYYSRGGLTSRSVEAIGGLPDRSRDRVLPVRAMADGNHVKVYLGETRVANVPNADMGRSRNLVFDIMASTRNPLMLSNFRIAAGGRTLYDALSADGRVATQGILFDTGSDRIRPESTPTLQEIGQMMQQHADLRVRIEGHTDNVGRAELNQALSERRAESVRRHLLDRYGIDAARLEAAGFGPSQPVDSNDTPEGRQNNRRVELVRL